MHHKHKASGVFCEHVTTHQDTREIWSTGHFFHAWIQELLMQLGFICLGSLGNNDNLKMNNFELCWVGAEAGIPFWAIAIFWSRHIQYRDLIHKYLMQLLNRFAFDVFRMKQNSTHVVYWDMYTNKTELSAESIVTQRQGLAASLVSQRKQLFYSGSLKSSIEMSSNEKCSYS